MKKTFILLFIFILLSQNIYSNELYNYFPKKLIPKGLKTMIVSPTEVSVSEKMHNYLLDTYKIPKGFSGILSRIWDTAGPILNHIKLEYSNITFTVLEMDKLFIMGLPNGEIFISTGLFNYCKSSDELAFVLGRELYFVVEGITPLIRTDMKIRENLKENIPVIDLYYGLRDRLNNIEADKNAAYYIFKCGHSPWNAHTFIKRTNNINQDDIEYFYNKDIENRLRALERHIKKSMPYSHLKKEKPDNFKNAYYFFVLGNKFLKSYMLDDAIKAYKESIALKPKISETHNNIGITYSKMGFYNQALYHYKIASELNNKDGRYFFNAAVAQIKLGKYKDALKNLKLSISADPSNIKVQRLFNSVETFIEETEGL